MEALLGVIIGGTISFVSVYFIEYQKDKKEAKRLKNERMEKIFFNYLKWENTFIKLYTLNVKFQQDKLNLQQLHKLIEETTKEDDIGDLHKQFLVYLNLYFPSLSEKYKPLDNARNGVSKYFLYEKININDMYKCFDVFWVETQKFKDFIIEESNSLKFL